MRKILIIIFLIFMVSLIRADDQDPVTVSPGEKTDMAIIEQSCPTFSWTAVSWAAGYRIAVFKADRFSLGLSYEEKKTREDPVLMKDIKGSALSWTPSAKNRLTNGQDYIWFVQAVDVNGSGVWSEGNRFKVVTELSFASIEYKENIQSVGLDEAIDTLKDLKPIKYNYKEDKEEQYLGFIAEDVPELVAMNERNGLHTMDVVTVLTKVVQDQQKKLKNEKEINNKQNELINNLIRRIEKLEAE